MAEQYQWTDNPTESGVAPCDTDVLNDCLMHLKYENSSATRNIGEIVASTIPLTDAGLHLLDGSLILGNGIYSDFVDYIAGIYDPTANYFCTESEWQASVTQYGVCGKFVYDSVNNTVRLPKYNSKIYTGGGTAPVIGNGISLGLTNGSNNFAIRSYSSNAYLHPTGAYGQPIGSDVGTYPSVSNDKSIGITLDPTKSGIIAQISNITTSLDGYYYIVIATSTKTDIQVDIDEIATDLNGKVDKSALSEVQCVVETYQNGTSWYRVYSDGWCEQGGLTNSINKRETVSVGLLKPFINVDYTISIATITTMLSAENVGVVTAKTSTSFTIGNQSADNSGSSIVVDWQACGYIEV